MFSVQHAYCPSAPKTAFSPQVRPPISEKTYSLSNLSYIQSKYPIKGVSPERHKETFNILCKKLPYELAQEILDLAEFWELRTERVEFGEKGKDVSYMLNEKLVEVGLSGKVREVIVVGWVIEGEPEDISPSQRGEPMLISFQSSTNSLTTSSEILITTAPSRSSYLGKGGRYLSPRI